MTFPLSFFGGKGGVGKTTLAAATALAAAEGGHDTLVVSTDPAHSLGDVFEQALDGEIRTVRPRLFAVEVDAEAAASAHVDAVEASISDSFDPELLPTVREHLALARTSPGTLEAALLDVMTRLMRDCPGRFDRLVFDTAPTGHTLRLLAMPALLSAWVEGLVRQRERVAGFDRMLRNMVGDDRRDTDPVMAALHDRRARFEEAGKRLRTDAAFWLVLTPERMALEETVRAERALTAQGIAVGGVILNQRLPDSAEGAFLATRREQQRRYEAEIGQRLPDRRLVVVEQRARDIAGYPDLAELARSLPPELTPDAQAAPRG